MEGSSPWEGHSPHPWACPASLLQMKGLAEPDPVIRFPRGVCSISWLPAKAASPTQGFKGLSRVLTSRSLAAGVCSQTSALCVLLWGVHVGGGQQALGKGPSWQQGRLGSAPGCVLGWSQLGSGLQPWPRVGV